MTSTDPPRGPGRPREFDLDSALDGAIQVFRERGYHATSVSDLSAAMQLTAGSIYKAFKDKRGVFGAAYERYTRTRHACMREAAARAQTGLGKVQAMLRFYADSSTGDEGRTGCLVTGSAVALSTIDSELADRVRHSIHELERALEGAIRDGQRDGSIAATVDASACACGLLCLVQGFRVVGKLGVKPAALHAAVDQMLRGLL